MSKKPLKMLERLAITDVAAEGNGLGHAADGRVVFVPLTAPGDVVDVQLVRKRKAFYEGIAVCFHELSRLRVEPVCSHFGECGGCKWQHLSYAEQLRAKQQQVVDSLKRIGHLNLPEAEPIIGAERQTGYRNKIEFTFSNRRWLTRDEVRTEGEIERGGGVGFHIAGAFDKVLDVDYCHLVGELENRVRNGLRDFAYSRGISFFDLRAQTGVLRDMIFRTSNSGEVMLVVQFHCQTPQEEGERAEVLEYLETQFPELSTICWVNNLKCNDTMSDLPIHVYKGRGFVTCLMEDLRFKVGPKSFYQTNNEQALKLYRKVREYAGLQGDELVYDLYCGTGTIGLFLARGCSQVVGIEYVPEAIEDARENARLNGIDNCYFIAGDVKDFFRPEMLMSLPGTHPTGCRVVIVDPPRAGMHPGVVRSLLETRAGRIVYVSCNPATQARDLNLLSSAYKVERFCPVDMFPHTHHIENVVLLEPICTPT